MQKDINDLIDEIGKRDKIITNLMCNIFAREYNRYSHYHGYKPERAIKEIDFNRTNLADLCVNLQDRAISRVFNDINELGGNNVDKAKVLSDRITPMLDGNYAKNLENEIRIALEQKRIQLMKES